MPDSKPTLRLFGLSLDLKVNVIALIAFVLSTGSIVLQGVQILRGPQVVMSNGERVNFVRRTHPAQPETPYLVINARLDYVNTGAVGRDAIVSSERLEIQFGDLAPYEYRWLHFELFVPDESGGPKVLTEDVAHSFLVPGGGAETHQTTFVAFRDASVRNADAKAAPVLWVDFLRLIETERPITLKFFAVDRRGNAYETVCTVVLTDPLLEALRKNHWATALCEANSSQTGSPIASSSVPPAPTKPAAHPPYNVRKPEP